MSLLQKYQRLYTIPYEDIRQVFSRLAEKYKRSYVDHRFDVTVNESSVYACLRIDTRSDNYEVRCNLDERFEYVHLYTQALPSDSDNDVYNLEDVFPLLMNFKCNGGQMVNEIQALRSEVAALRPIVDEVKAIKDLIIEAMAKIAWHQDLQSESKAFKEKPLDALD